MCLALFPFTGKLKVPIKWRLEPITSSSHCISGFVAPPAWFNWRMLAVIPRKQWVMNYYTQLLFIRCHICVRFCATRAVIMEPHIDDRRQMTCELFVLQSLIEIFSVNKCFFFYIIYPEFECRGSILCMCDEMWHETSCPIFTLPVRETTFVPADSSSDINLTQSVPTVITFD